MRTATRAALVLVGCLAPVCATAAPQTGILAARWTAHAGQTVPVTLSWESESDTHGRITATLGPGGERFTGQYVRVTVETRVEVVQPIVDGWEGVWTGYDWGAPVDPWGAGIEADGTTYYSGFVREYSGKVVATLFGNRTHSMRCRFTLDDPSRGFLGGGVGECQTSDGGVLDADF